jgi:hypothetical protein
LSLTIKVKAMRTKTFDTTDHKKGSRRHDYPERQVGFPERNDVTNPNDEMERVHVDLETLNISRTNSSAFTREITGQRTAEDMASGEK